jgi:large subunit ribosomal protein L15
MTDLTTLVRPRSLKHARRVGRGGKRGKTSGRGGKGQTARAGAKLRPEWRDIIKKLPKRRGHGVNRARTVRPRASAVALTLEKLSKHFAAGERVTVKALIEKGLVRRVSGNVPPLKILARGELDKKLTISKGITLSEGAQTALERSGSTIL